MKWDKRYKARTKDGAISIFLGRYDTKEEAQQAVYDYRVLHGLPVAHDDLVRRAANARRLLRSLGLE